MATGWPRAIKFGKCSRDDKNIFSCKNILPSEGPYCSKSSVLVEVRESMRERGIINAIAAGDVSARAGILLGSSNPIMK